MSDQSCLPPAEQRFAILTYSRDYPSADMLRSLTEVGFTVAERPPDRGLFDLVADLEPHAVVFVLHPAELEDRHLAQELGAAVHGVMVAVGPLGEARHFPSLLANGVDVCLADEFGPEGIAMQVATLADRDTEVAADPVDKVLAAGRLIVDTQRFEVRLGDAACHVSPQEFRLLAALVRNGDKVVSSADLLREIHDNPRAVADPSNTVKVYIRRLRERLEQLEPGTRFISNVRGFGYMLADPRANTHPNR